MDNKQIEIAIKHASILLSKDVLPTGNYGKLHRYHKVNAARKFVAKHLKRNTNAIMELMFNDRNVYLENDIHHKNKLLNDFLEVNRKHMELATYKSLKNSIGSFIRNCS